MGNEISFIVFRFSVHLVRRMRIEKYLRSGRDREIGSEKWRGKRARSRRERRQPRRDPKLWARRRRVGPLLRPSPHAMALSGSPFSASLCLPSAILTVIEKDWDSRDFDLQKYLEKKKQTNKNEESEDLSLSLSDTLRFFFFFEHSLVALGHWFCTLEGPKTKSQSVDVYL